MQQRMDLFGAALPEVLQHRFNYGLQLYYIGQVMAGQVGHKSQAGDDSEPPVNLVEAKHAVGLVEMVYHGIHNLDISIQVQVPHEMLLAMNPSQIFEVYGGSWLLKMNADTWGEAINRHNFWQVVGAARRIILEKPLNSYLLRRLDELCGRTYAADEDGNLPARLQRLPQSVATEFMRSFTEPFRSPGDRGWDSYVSVKKLKEGLDVAVFGHFAQKFAEGERQLSLARA